ncbi:MAG: nucleoside-diphosphate kinase [Deltaproteobacteria bacterium RIFOXYA12_FULL_61_11]|nr:MAG: nucleoside-diphosphate kinase [Deltaproteobacteria bacterium RIFOXYA12_FULL_61_11]
MERTFTFIKPDVVSRNLVGAVIARYEAEGLRVAALKRLHLSKVKAQGFYAVHRSRPFFDSLTAFMTEGPVVAMVLEGDSAMDKVRRINGATNPSEAAPGTIRKDFGTNIERNAVHGSDSLENAAKEIAHVFSELEIF